MLFRLIDGKVKKLLSNQREGGERKGPRAGGLKGKSERVWESKGRNKATYHRVLFHPVSWLMHKTRV